MLLIDGAYLFMGSRDLEKKTNRKLCLGDLQLKVLFDYIQQKSGVSYQQDLKYFVTAEYDMESMCKRQSLYESLTKQGVNVDIRTFKSKQAFCPNNQCEHSKKGGTGFPI